MRIVLGPAQKVELNITDYSYLDLPVPAPQDSSQVQAATPVEKPTGIAEEKNSSRWMYYAGGGLTIGGLVTYFLIKPNPGSDTPGIPPPTLPDVN